jgi:hypothetical protein
MDNTIVRNNYATHYMDDCWPLFHYPVDKKISNGQVIILGNAHGVMPYQEPLARLLNEHNWETFWFPFSGQPYMLDGKKCTARGRFTSEDLANDLPKAIEYIGAEFLCETKNSRHIIAHCASGLITMHYLINNPAAPIKSVISYGLLANAIRVKERALSEMWEVGVKSIVDSDVWSYDGFVLASSLKNSKIPFLFCYPDDAVNHRRSTFEEIKKIASTIPNGYIKSFDKGYDLKASNVHLFLSTYLDWLSS